jgi:hypothetical protein
MGRQHWISVGAMSNGGIVMGPVDNFIEQSWSLGQNLLVNTLLLEK